MTETSGAIIVLEAVINLITVDGVREQLLSAVAEDRGVTVDAGAVECLTTPGVQLLLAASRSVAECGQRFRLINPTHAVQDAFGEMGLSATLEQWSN